MNATIHHRSFQQLDDSGFDDLKDPFGLLVVPQCKLLALQADPYLKDDTQVAQVVGAVGNDVAGFEYVFPVRVRAGDQVYTAAAGSTLSVLPEFRRSGLGMDLPELRIGTSPDEIGLGAGLSQQALPIHELSDYAVFLQSRFIALFKSRSVVEMKIPRALRWFFRLAGDCVLGLYHIMLQMLTAAHLRGLTVHQVEPEDRTSLDEIVSLVNADTHLCREEHDFAWFVWHLKYSFAEKGASALYLVRQNGRPVAFYMTKTRFHEQASHRGFKNVWLGSVIEWGGVSAFAARLRWLLLHAVISFGPTIDAAEICTDDSSLNTFFAHCGLRHIGDGNFVIKAGEGSPLLNSPAWSTQSAWRLRPASGDNGMS